MSLYLDASVLVPLFMVEDQSRILERWIESVNGTLLISDLAASEFAATLSRFIRQGALDSDQANTLHTAFDRWKSEAAEPVENRPVDIRNAARLVRTPKPKLLTPDAIHLATCQRLGLTLVTHDQMLLEIAKREGVEHICPV